MNLLDRFRAWLNRDTTEAINRMSLNFQDAFERQREAIAHHSNMLTRFAASCNSLELALTDRLDIIEGRLDEMKPQAQPETVSAGGHKRWTQRRDERASKHFNVSEFVTKLQKAGTNGE
jgi:hypothetical protein